MVLTFQETEDEGFTFRVNEGKKTIQIDCFYCNDGPKVLTGPTVNLDEFVYGFEFTGKVELMSNSPIGFILDTVDRELFMHAYYVYNTEQGEEELADLIPPPHTSLKSFLHILTTIQRRTDE